MINFTVEQDDVEFILGEGNATTIYRNSVESRNFSVQIRDTDKQELLSIGSGQRSIWITTDGSSYDSGAPGFVNSMRSSKIAI